MEVLSIRHGAADAGERLARSLRETGFAVVTGHPVPVGLISRAYEEWQRFFSSNDKHAFTFDPPKQDGYFPFRSENAKGHPAKDLKEFFHVYPGSRLPEHAADVTRELYRRLAALAGDLLALLEDHTASSTTDGFYRSTTHRVVNPVGEEAGRPRLSMPLFLHPWPEVRLSATHTAGEYLDERLREIGLK